MPLRPDGSPATGGAGARPAAGRVRERSMPGDGAAPLRRRRRTEAGVGLGIGSGGASRGTGGGSAPDALLSSDESPVAWLLWSLAAASALQSLSLDRGVVNLLRSAHLLGLPKETRIRGERQGFSWPSDGTSGGGDKKEAFCFVSSLSLSLPA